MLKIAPVSGDFLIKAGLILGALGLGYLLVKKATSAATDAAGAVVDSVVGAAQAVNPMNNDNVIAGAVNSAIGGMVSDTAPGRNADGSWTLGGAIYDLTHPNIFTP